MAMWNTSEQPHQLVHGTIGSGPLTTSINSTTVLAADMVRHHVYQYIVPLLIFFCALSVLMNIRVLVSVHWLQAHVSPTLYISLSLAGADAFTSLVLGAGLVVNSALRVHAGYCWLLVLEALRLGGVICTVLHLLVLATNHYVGILRPLHYTTWITRRTTMVCVIALWLLPTAFFMAYFWMVQGQAQGHTQCIVTFLRRYRFRAIFCSFFFCPLVLMVFIYTHIFIMVRRHLHLRAGFVSVRCDTTSSRRTHSAHRLRLSVQQQQVCRSMKAAHTTLYILGSFLLGWMPAVLVFLLVCDDCMFPLDAAGAAVMSGLHATTNLLVILKTLVNPVIYAARMKDVKLAHQRMQASLCRRCCCVDALQGSSGMDSDLCTYRRRLSGTTEGVSLEVQRVSGRRCDREGTTKV